MTDISDNSEPVTIDPNPIHLALRALFSVPAKPCNATTSAVSAEAGAAYTYLAPDYPRTNLVEFFPERYTPSAESVAIELDIKNSKAIAEFMAISGQGLAFPLRDTLQHLGLKSFDGKNTNDFTIMVGYDKVDNLALLKQPARKTLIIMKKDAYRKLALPVMDTLSQRKETLGLVPNIDDPHDDKIMAEMAGNIAASGVLTQREHSDFMACAERHQNYRVFAALKDYKDKAVKEPETASGVSVKQCATPIRHVGIFLQTLKPDVPSKKPSHEELDRDFKDFILRDILAGKVHKFRAKGKAFADGYSNKKLFIYDEAKRGFSPVLQPSLEAEGEYMAIKILPDNPRLQKLIPLDGTYKDNQHFYTILEDVIAEKFQLQTHENYMVVGAVPSRGLRDEAKFDPRKVNEYVILISKDKFEYIAEKMLEILGSTKDGSRLMGLSKEDYRKALKVESGSDGKPHIPELVRLIETVLSNAELSDTAKKSLIAKSTIDERDLNYEFAALVRGVIPAEAEAPLTDAARRLAIKWTSAAKETDGKGRVLKGGLGDIPGEGLAR